MKLMHPLFSSPIHFRENSIQVLTIEHAPTFRKTVLELTAQAEGGEGRFILSEDGSVLDCGESLRIISDYAHLEQVDKRLAGKLILALIREAHEELALETAQLSLAVQRYLGRLCELADFPVGYDRSENIAALLKAMNFGVDLGHLDAEEALYERISLNNLAVRHLCMVLVHAKAYFSPDELSRLYRMARYRKWNLLLLESHPYPERLEGKEHLLFDRDLCELRLENGDKFL